VYIHMVYMAGVQVGSPCVCEGERDRECVRERVYMHICETFWAVSPDGIYGGSANTLVYGRERVSEIVSQRESV